MDEDVAAAKIQRATRGLIYNKYALDSDGLLARDLITQEVIPRQFAVFIGHKNYDARGLAQMVYHDLDAGRLASRVPHDRSPLSLQHSRTIFRKAAAPEDWYTVGTVTYDVRVLADKMMRHRYGLVPLTKNLPSCEKLQKIYRRLGARHRDLAEAFRDRFRDHMVPPHSAFSLDRFYLSRITWNISQGVNDATVHGGPLLREELGTPIRKLHPGDALVLVRRGDWYARVPGSSCAIIREATIAGLLDAVYRAGRDTSGWLTSDKDVGLRRVDPVKVGLPETFGRRLWKLPIASLGKKI